MPTFKFRDYHLEKLQDKEEAPLYLEVALEEYEGDGDTQAFFQALKDVADAQNGMPLPLPLWERSARSGG